MTQDEKRICAERLFDGIGLIDDRFIVEAATPYGRKRSAKGFRALLIGAVSIALAMSVAAGAFVVGMMSGQNKAEDDDVAEDVNTGVVDGTTHANTLSAQLSSLRAETEVNAVDMADIDLFDSQAKVIWKYADEELYRVKPITDGERERLVTILSKDKGERVTQVEAEAVEGVWIATGDGRVISPYLEQTAGNVGYGELFDYQPEYEPTEEFSEYLCDCIS